MLITPLEAARRLNVRRKTIYGYIRNGLMPVTRVGKAVRISPEQMATFLKNSKERYGNKDRIFHKPKNTKVEEEVMVGAVDIATLKRIGIIQDSSEKIINVNDL